MKPAIEDPHSHEPLPLASESTGCLNPRQLHKKLMEVVDEAEGLDTPVETLGRLLRSLAGDPVIPIIGGRIWVRDHDDFRLIDRSGGRKEVPPDYRIAASEEILQLVLAKGSCFVERTDPAYNKRLEQDLGVQDFAAMTFGDDGQFILSVDVTATKFEDREEIVNFLYILRHVMNRRIEKDHFDWIIREARDIQTSILPKTTPTFRDYDVFGKSLPAEKERVGGDLFDFLEVDDQNLAVVVADSSGHGLPAALMARDVRTAVHMAVLGEIKPTRMISRINRIITEQAPLGRFISFFYGEIDKLDQMIYTSAGHPGLLLTADGTRHLREGGPVLGIHPEAEYARGVCLLAPGDIFCVYTDGLSEARNLRGDLFGEERIHQLLRDGMGKPAREIVSAVFEEVHRFTNGIQDDDQTMVVVRRDA